MKLTNTIATIFVLLTLTSATAFGDDTSMKKQDRHHTPPSEAYTACEGLSAGDTAEFVTPHGDTVTGTCEQRGDQLVLRPDHPPKGDFHGKNMESDNE